MTPSPLFGRNPLAVLSIASKALGALGGISERLGGSGSDVIAPDVRSDRGRHWCVAGFGLLSFTGQEPDINRTPMSVAFFVLAAFTTVATVASWGGSDSSVSGPRTMRRTSGSTSTSVVRRRCRMSSAGILCSMAATRIAKDHGDQEAQLGFVARLPIHTWVGLRHHHVAGSTARSWRHLMRPFPGRGRGPSLTPRSSRPRPNASASKSRNRGAPTPRGPSPRFSPLFQCAELSPRASRRG